MYKQPNFKKGVLFALFAAALNASIGVFSKILMESGFSPSAIAFIKTVIGFFLISIFIYGIRKSGNKSSWIDFAICSFLGIFVLFFFETAAYQHYSAAGVVVILMAGAAISAIILGRIFLKDAITANSILGALLAIVGVMVIFGFDFREGVSLKGVFFAFIAGCGYGAFSVAVKKKGLSGGLYLTRQLLLFGSIYLFLPFSIEGFSLGDLSLKVALVFLLLATFPTILGFFCTTKAIEYIKPSQVQVLELTEPIFASVFAFFIVGEIPGLNIYLGGLIIVVGLIFSNNIIKVKGIKI